MLHRLPEKWAEKNLPIGFCSTGSSTRYVLPTFFWFYRDYETIVWMVWGKFSIHFHSQGCFLTISLYQNTWYSFVVLIGIPGAGVGRQLLPLLFWRNHLFQRKKSIFCAFTVNFCNLVVLHWPTHLRNYRTKLHLHPVSWSSSSTASVWMLQWEKYGFRFPCLSWIIANIQKRHNTGLCTHARTYARMHARAHLHAQTCKHMKQMNTWYSQ